MIVLGTIGLGVAGYLTYVHYSGAIPLCGKNGGSCLTVQTSVYSKLAGVPVPVLGLVGYTGILASLVAPQRETTRLATLLFTVAGFAFSAYLTYREVFSIHAICEWCVSSAVIMTILMVLAIWRLLRAEPDVRPLPGGSPRNDASAGAAGDVADAQAGASATRGTAADGASLTLG
jgi:uncharacterized membrane protein